MLNEILYSSKNDSSQEISSYFTCKFSKLKKPHPSSSNVVLATLIFFMQPRVSSSSVHCS